jgi:molybdenum cofactor cytidylyltransferase
MPNSALEHAETFGAVILAAGASSRMGRPKMLLPWGNDTVLGHLLRLWSGLPTAQIAVVCSGSDTAIFAELDRLQFPGVDRIINPDPARGMFSSIRCAAAWNGWKSILTHYAVVLGDQPHLRSPTLRALADFAVRNPECVCQPSHLGRPRHPVWFPQCRFRELAGSTAENLKQHLEFRPNLVKLIELDDPGFDLDLDYPEDYRKALALSFGDRPPGA